MFLNPTQPLLHVKVLAVCWNVTVQVLLCPALLKLIGLRFCVRWAEALCNERLGQCTCVCFLSGVAEAKASWHRTVRQGLLAENATTHNEVNFMYESQIK